MTTLLEIVDLRAGYGGARVLDGVSITVGKSETIAVVGSNGAGKTTLIRTIAGMVPATGGSVRFNGQDITNWSSDRICELGLAQVPEGRQLFGGLSVEDNLQLGAVLRRAHARSTETYARVMDIFPKLKERRAQLAGTLSGGEQQMVAIGRALLADPVLIMFDEPSLGLAPVMVELMFETIQVLARDGMSILLVEQNVAESLTHSARAYVLEDGEVVLEGVAAALMSDPRVRKAYLGL